MGASVETTVRLFNRAAAFLNIGKTGPRGGNFVRNIKRAGTCGGEEGKICPSPFCPGF